MKKSDGILSLKKAAKLLNKHAPDGESLAYINPEEARLLKSRGGSGIMTLAGVPTYGPSEWWDTIKKYGKKATDWLGYTGGDGGGQQLMKDIASMWGGYEGMKESKELSEWEKQQYAEQKAKEDLNTALFAGQTDSGAQLLAPQNVPADTTAVSAYRPIDFSGSATPDLTTTAVAEGGRIGYNGGGLTQYEIFKLKELGYPKADSDPGSYGGVKVLKDILKLHNYAQGGRIGASNGGIQSLNQQLNSLPEYYMPYPAAQGGRIGYGSGTVAPNRPYTGSGNLAADLSGLFSSKLAGKKYVSPQSGNVLSDNFYGKMLTSNPDAIQAFSSLNDADLYAEWENYIADGGDLEYEEWKQTRMVAAQGGRIGAFNGGIQGLMPRPGFAFGTEVVEDTTVTEDIFSNIPPEMKMVDLDNLPEIFLIELEKLIEDYFEDIGERPRTINDIEKWYRGKNKSTMNLRENIQAPTLMASASDPMDDKNQISLRLFGKPLHDLNEDELIDLEEWLEDKAQKWQGAQGGRIGAQEGGVMPLLNLGGMEKDYREDGGFVPLGRQEKADDVPARLSKNEFVFTADAVKAAGGGDIDEGAQRMYNVMKNLEAGGEISQESQGQA